MGCGAAHRRRPPRPRRCAVAGGAARRPANPRRGAVAALRRAQPLAAALFFRRLGAFRRVARSGRLYLML